MSWLHEIYDDPDVRVRHITTTVMAADIHTKVFTSRPTWDTLCLQCKIVPEPPIANQWPSCEQTMLLHKVAYATTMSGTSSVNDGAAGRTPMPQVTNICL